MESRKIFILLGNPDADTFSGKVADTYESAARDSGHDVRRLNIGELEFDPILHKGYKEIQEIEPDLLRVQENIRWADHFVVIYPNWWCTMPAILKGMFDRMWLPGFAFNFDKETKKLIKRLSGKTARVIIISGVHNPLSARIKFGDFTNEISKGILGFSGMKVAVSAYGPVEKCSQEERERFLQRTQGMGKLGI